MKFDIFGKKVLEVIRSDGQWIAFYCGNGGVKLKADDIRVPSSLVESELGEYIADVFHEWATLDPQLPTLAVQVMPKHRIEYIPKYR